MGKRQRRRNRQKAKATGQRQQQPTAAPKADIVQYPTAGTPLLQVDIAAGTPPEIRDMCLAYWEFEEPGTWARNVSAIGATSFVYATVKEACTVSLLTVACPDCSSPLRVTSRSEMTATGFWKAGAMPADTVHSAVSCADCQKAQREARAQRVAAEKLKGEEQREARRTNAGRWLDAHREHGSWKEEPSMKAALALLSMTDILEKSGTGSFGPLDKAAYSFTGSGDGDFEVMRELHSNRWLAPTTPATIDNFAYKDDDTVHGVYPLTVPWRLAHWAGDDTAAACADVRSILFQEIDAFEDLDFVQEVVHDLEADMIVKYLGGLLENKYDEAPIPEARIPEAHETAKTALEGGFTLKQMLAVAWSATSRSAAWGARTEWVKPGMVSSAAVTNLGKGVGYAKDRGVQEYEPPHWLKEPAILAPARRLLAEHAKAREAMAAFRSIHQRIVSRADDPVDFHDELDDTGFKDFGQQFQDWVTDLKAGRPTRDETHAMTYAVVTPDGEMQIKDGTAKTMRDEVSLAGAGFVDRVMLDTTRTINAYVGELVPPTKENDNRVAVEMLRLLGDEGGKLFGPIAFFQVGPGSHRPGGLDREHQDLIRAAHQAVVARTSTST
ncbi:hypothetical protein [Streptomyces nigrescens]